jgi:hypothetical protein
LTENIATSTQIIAIYAQTIIMTLLFKEIANIICGQNSQTYLDIITLTSGLRTVKAKLKLVNSIVVDKISAKH